MNLRWMISYAIGFVLAAVLIVALFSMTVSRSSNRQLPSDAGEFLRSVDLAPLDRSAVHSEGRLKSFDSFAQEILGLVSGPLSNQALPPDLAYFDMMIRSERYADAPTIYVKHADMRKQIASLMQSQTKDDAAKAAIREFEATGLISRRVLQSDSVQELLSRWDQDVVRTAKHAGAVRTALGLSSSQALVGMLTMIPPSDGQAGSPWLSVAELFGDGGRLSPAGAQLKSEQPEAYAQLRAGFGEIVTAWQREDAPAVNAALSAFCAQLPLTAPDLYPSQRKLELESLYFQARHLTWGWVIYLLGLVMLLMATVYRWDVARASGMGIFTAAFLLHTAALAWRWYVAGRWPNSNMFEAVTTSVWFGALVALLIEVVARKTPMRNLFAIGGAGAAMCGLMAAHFVPELNPSINNMMPVLHDLWLYIHTNVIIASYALIAMAAVTATLYILRRIAGGSADYARAGGAAVLMDAAGATTDPTERRVTLGEVFDGATMILMELSFVMLWAGIIMGAIWADHSWGRPWGWDPKEVFALNTFLVFLILVHVRLKAQDKGMWTAILAVAGAGVMIFNWIVINFIISGLHSYA